nr:MULTISPECIES: diguanylate cyclase [unclassified Rhizobium]
MLCQVAARLMQLVADGDLVARLGGDEFALLLRLERRENIERFAERLPKSLSAPSISTVSTNT